MCLVKKLCTISNRFICLPNEGTITESHKSSLDNTCDFNQVNIVIMSQVVKVLKIHSEKFVHKLLM